MDKYEYREKTEQMLAYAEKKQYKEAMEIADVIDWRRVKSVLMLSSVSEIYERNGEYKKSREVLKYAYERQPGSRKLAYRLGTIALKDHDIEAASDYYEEFVQIAPKDPNQYILKYKILKAQNGDIKEQIAALEDFKEAEYIEKWAYELAKLYHEAGMTAECLEECDDLMLWFSDGKYVYRAMELKMKYKPLTPLQQEKYDARPGAQARRMAEAHVEAQEKAKAKAAEAAKLAADRKAAKAEESKEETIESAETDQVSEAIVESVEEAATEEDLTAEEKAEESLADSIVNLLKDEIEDGSKISDEALRATGQMKIDNIVRAWEEQQKVNAETIEKLRLEKEARLQAEKEAAAKKQEEERLLVEKMAAEAEAKRIAEEEEAARIAAEEEAAKKAAEEAATRKAIEEAEAREAARIAAEEEAAKKAAEEEAARIAAEEEKARVIDEKTRKIPDDIVRLMSEIETDMQEEAEEVSASPITEESILDVVNGSEEMELEEVEFDEDEFEEEELSVPEFAEETDHSIQELKMSENLESAEDDEFNLDELVEALEEVAEESAVESVEEPAEEAVEESAVESVEEPAEEVTEEVAEDFSEEDFEEAELEEEDFEEEELTEEDLNEEDFEEEELSPEDAMKDIDKALDALTIEEPTEAEIQRRMKQNTKGGVPFDTGFVVTGRYDLSATSEIGLKAGLTEDQKKLFSYFVPVRGMSEQLVEVLDNDKRAKREGTSKTGNLMVIGRKGSGKTVLAVDIVKAIQKQRNLKQGKVAIVTGESLNKKDMAVIFEKLHGGAMIIEQAGAMSKKTVMDMNLLMERKTGEMLIVLEDQKKPMERLMTANPEFKKKFNSKLELPVFINDELVTFGQTYAKENGYKLDEMGILALYSRIDVLQREDHAVSVAEVKDIMDEAIEHSKKANVKHLARRMFGKRKDDKNRVILTESDF